MREQTKADQLAIEQGCVFNPELAKPYITFIERECTISKGPKAGQRVTLLAWQKEIIEQLYGWRKPDGSLRFRFAFIQISKKVGKSAFGAWLSMANVFCSEEQSPIVLTCASSRDQAARIFEEIVYCRENNKPLHKATKCTPSRKRFEYPKRNAIYQTISSDVGSSHGWDASFLLCDELHAWNNDELFESLRYATSSRTKSGLICVITTAGHDKTSKCFDLYQQAKAILNGDSDRTDFLPIIHEAENDCDILDKSQWYRACPSLGETQTEAQFEADALAAKSSPSEELAFRQLRLNCWLDRDLRAQFIPLELWDSCRGEIPELTGHVCHLALDIGKSRDLTVLAGIFPDAGKYYVKYWAWCPAEAASMNEKENAHRYLLYQQQRSLTITPGNLTDQRLIRTKIQELQKLYRIESLTVDMWDCGKLAVELAEEDRLNVQKCPPFPSYTNKPMRDLLALVKDKKLVHDGSELLRWSCQNLQTKSDERERIIWAKPNHAAKIDPMVAIIMALSQCPITDEPSKPRFSFAKPVVR